MADVSEAQSSSEPTEERGERDAPAADQREVAAQPSTDGGEPQRASAEPVAEGGEAHEGAETSTGGETPEGEATAADGTTEAGGKRKRRRRRKGKSSAGTEDAPSPEAAEARARRAAAAAPFLRFFVGPNAGRKHGFAVGEVVAGRVKSTEGGAITIDLFGKALAYADEHEPREVPPEPQPAPPEPPPPPQASAPESAPSESVTAAGEPAPAALEAASEPATTEQAADGSASAAASAESTSAEAAEAAAVDAEHAEAAEAVAREAAESLAAEDDDGGGEGEGAHDAPHPARGPLPPAPIVPDELPRQEPVQLGQVFRGRVGAIAESGHIAIVNRIIDRKAVKANAERYRTERRRVLGIVFGFNRGGFDVLVEGVRAFCPASAMSLEEIPDPNAIVGQRLEFLLPTAQNTNKDLIVSRRSILERLYRKKARELMRSLQPGQKLKGRVTAVREFGLFVDIGGIEGLVHQSELSFAHGVRPGDVAKPGDEVEVQVLRVGGDPNRTAEGVRRDRVDRVSLSMKALQPDPWDQHGDVLREGGVVNGKVTRTTDFGAFIELVPQIEGLLHITELGRDLKHADQAVKEGDELPVVIERIDRRARRISLSKLTAEEAAEIQSMQEAGQELQSVRPGARVKVKVARVEPRGLLVRVSGVVGRRGRGYVPASELVNRSGDLRKQFAIGTELEVKIVGLDRDGGLRCSPKALQIDDERRAVKDYRREAARQGFGTFGDLLKAKLGGQPETK